MSVLVKGMKMPKDCPQCLLSSWSPITNEFLGCFVVPGKRYAVLDDKEYAGSTKRPDWCPLVELPEKHGRLVEFIDVTTRYDDDSGTEEINLGEVFGAYIKMREAPTVIEAEGE